MVTSATKRPIDVVIRGIYWLLAIVSGVAGVAVLLVGTGILPAWVRAEIFDFGDNNPLTMHLVQEMAALYVFMSVLFGYFARHYEQSDKFHWAVTLLFGLIAWVHWFNAYGVFGPAQRALTNAVPFALFVMLGLLRRRAAARVVTAFVPE